MNRRTSPQAQWDRTWGREGQCAGCESVYSNCECPEETRMALEDHDAGRHAGNPRDDCPRCPGGA